MTKFWEALSSHKQIEKAKHTVTIASKQYEVSLEKKLEVIKHGEENYMIVDNEIVKKPVQAKVIKHSLLKLADKGYKFVDNDPHWIESTIEGKYKWRK